MINKELSCKIIFCNRQWQRIDVTKKQPCKFCGNFSLFVFAEKGGIHWQMGAPEIIGVVLTLWHHFLHSCHRILILNVPGSPLVKFYTVTLEVFTLALI